MGEIIQIHVGQAGVQIANACWELYCLEHGVRADGSLCYCPRDHNISNVFDFKDTHKVVPRAVLIDSEPNVIDQIKTGPYGCLFNPESLITGKEDSGSNYARGYYTLGSEIIDVTMEAIQSAAESCCNLRGFLIFRSIGGGTGSGLGNLILEHLQDCFEKITKMEFIIFPSPSISPLIVEPYNALLASHMGMDSIECSCILDNEALYDICSKKLNINAPKYKNLNRIIAQTVSTFTTSQRFSGSGNVSFSEFQTNLVPYPRIHFPLVSYAPFIPGTGSGYINFTTEQITNACFEPSNQLVRCNPAEGKYMTSVLLYRGEVSNSEINSSLQQLRDSDAIRFVDWSPTGFKVGMNSEPPFSVPCGGLGNSNKAVVALSNNTIIQKAWCRLIKKYNHLYSRKAFIHHYIAEGLEEDSLKEASEDICALISDYKEVDEDSLREHTPKRRKSREGIRNSSFKNLPKSAKTPTNSHMLVSSEHNELSLPRLPGLQSPNYFFSEPNISEEEIKQQVLGPKQEIISKSTCQCCCECGLKANPINPRTPSLEILNNVTISCVSEPEITQPMRKSKSLSELDGGASSQTLDKVKRRSKSLEPQKKEKLGQKESKHDGVQKTTSVKSLENLSSMKPVLRQYSNEVGNAKDKFSNYLSKRNTGTNRLSFESRCANLNNSSNFKECSRNGHFLRYGQNSKRRKCFCCNDGDELRFVNSDDRLLPMACRAPRNYTPQESCFCDDEENGNIDASSTIMMQPRCSSTNAAFCQKEIVCLPRNEVVYEGCPESNLMGEGVMCTHTPIDSSLCSEITNKTQDKQ